MRPAPLAASRQPGGGGDRAPVGGRGGKPGADTRLPAPRGLRRLGWTLSKGWQIAAAAVLVGGLLGWYGAATLEEGAFRYYQTLDEFRAAGSPGERARVHGYVVEGSIARDLEGRAVHFRIQADPPHAGGTPDGALAVRYASLEVPDLFKDGAEVVVEGQLDPGAGGEPVFVATNVLAKCPSKFQPDLDPETASRMP